MSKIDYNDLTAKQKKQIEQDEFYKKIMKLIKSIKEDDEERQRIILKIRKLRILVEKLLKK